MSRVVVVNNLTLDGVMQSPSHPDEDRRGGFEQGGWAPPYADTSWPPTWGGGGGGGGGGGSGGRGGGGEVFNRLGGGRYEARSP